MILGVIVGGAASWLRQGKWRRAARKLDGEVRVLHQELAAMRNRFVAGTPTQPAAEPNPGPNPAPMAAIPPPGT